MTIGKWKQITKSIFPDLINFMDRLAKIAAVLINKSDIVTSQEDAGVVKMSDQIFKSWVCQTSS